jgi:hypothetical protein
MHTQEWGPHIEAKKSTGNTMRTNRFYYTTCLHAVNPAGCSSESRCARGVPEGRNGSSAGAAT